MMKLSMMSYTMARQPEHFDLEEMLKLTRELDLDGIDFVGLHDKTAKELRKMADDHGVPVICHTFSADFDHEDDAARKSAVEGSKQSIDDAVELGAPVVMIPTGGKAGEDRNAARRRWIRGLKELQPFAREAGVVLTVENFPGAESPFVIAADMLEAVREVPEFKITFDNGNAAGGEDPAESFARCAEHVVHAHFKDWTIVGQNEGTRMLDGRWYKPALIGEGIVDHKSCLAAMQAAGYDGHIDIEYEGNDYKPADAVRRAVDYLRELGA